MKKPLIAASAVLLSLGFAGVADAYPVPTPPTTEVGVRPPTPPPDNPQLPATGGDINESLLMGAAVAALGGGLILVTRRRKHTQS